MSEAEPRERERRERESVLELALVREPSDLLAAEEPRGTEQLARLRTVRLGRCDATTHDVLAVREERRVRVALAADPCVLDDEARLLERLDLRSRDHELAEVGLALDRRHAARELPLPLAEGREQLAPALLLVELLHVVLPCVHEPLGDEPEVLHEADLACGLADHDRTGVLDHDRLIVGVLRLAVHDALRDDAEQSPSRGVEDASIAERCGLPGDERLVGERSRGGVAVLGEEKAQCPGRGLLGRCVRICCGCCGHDVLLVSRDVVPRHHTMWCTTVRTRWQTGEI